MFKRIWLEVRRVLHPRAVLPLRYQGGVVSEIVRAVYTLVMLYVCGYFAGEENPKEGVDRVACLDASTGEVLWSFDYPALIYDNEHGGGVIGTGGVLDTPPQEWDRMIASNLDSVYYVTRQVAPHLIENGGGDYDFLGGFTRHKADWGAEALELQRFVLAGRQARGQLFLRLPEWREQAGRTLRALGLRRAKA